MPGPFGGPMASPGGCDCCGTTPDCGTINVSARYLCGSASIGLSGATVTVSRLGTAIGSGPTSGPLSTVSMYRQGTGYTTATATVSGDGSGAVLACTIAGGAITGITVVNGGTGYTHATIAIAGDGAGARAVPLITATFSVPVPVAGAAGDYTATASAPGFTGGTTVLGAVACSGVSSVTNVTVTLGRGNLFWTDENGTWTLTPTSTGWCGVGFATRSVPVFTTGVGGGCVCTMASQSVAYGVSVGCPGASSYAQVGFNFRYSQPCVGSTCNSVVAYTIRGGTTCSIVPGSPAASLCETGNVVIPAGIDPINVGQIPIGGTSGLQQPPFGIFSPTCPGNQIVVGNTPVSGPVVVGS